MESMKMFGISSCPAGHLRHRAYCVLVLAWQRLKENKPTKQQQLPKIDARGGPGGLGGRFWDHFGSLGFPRGIPGTPRAEKVRKSSTIPRPFPIFVALLKSHICIYVYMYTYIYIYTYISSCPAGHLRHRAYCVLCFGVAEAHRRQTHEATKTTKNGITN